MSVMLIGGCCGSGEVDAAEQQKWETNITLVGGNVREGLVKDYDDSIQKTTWGGMVGIL